MARKSRKQNADSVLTNINKTGIYVRFSSADNGVPERASIDNQRDYICSELSKYRNINIVSIYTDNGFSGTNFHRNGWEQLIADIKAKKINCIAVKDLSRLGRNAVEAGNYLEKVFPFLGVRFISINDKYDSEKDNYNKTMVENAFKNIMNELYARDISRKVKSGINARRNLGYIQSSQIAYGYKKSDDSRCLLLDENTAPVVRKIFEWRKSGKRLTDIIKALNTLAVPSPGKYLYMSSSGQKYKKYANASWSFANVRHILADVTYTGVLIQGKTSTSVFEGKVRKHTPQSQWNIRENAHPALVSKDDFDYIQSLATKTYIKPKTKNPLKGKAVCGLCGYKIARTYRQSNKTYYHCTSHGTQLKNKCNVSIHEKDIKSTIIETLSKLISLLVDKSQLAKEIKNSKAFKDSINKQNREINTLKGHIAVLNHKIKNLYDDLKSGIISETEFTFIKDGYNKELSDLNIKLQDLSNRHDKASNLDEQVKKVEKLLNQLEKAKNNDEYLYSLIKQVKVYPQDRLEIKFNFTDGFADLLALEKEVDYQ